MIPKKIHYCWFGGNELPLLEKECMKSWAKLLPEYEIIRWDETNSPMDNEYVQYHYKKKNWAFVADYVRLYALYQDGGIYLDTDMEVVKNFEPLRNNSMFLGEELPGRPTAGIIGGEKHHAFFKNALDFILKRHSEGKENVIMPDICKTVYNHMRNDGTVDDIHIYESEYFYPYHPYDKGRPEKNFLLASYITDNTFTVHHWAYSWKKNIFLRIIRRIKLKLKG